MVEETKEWWWFDKDFEFYFGAMFECGDFERLCDKIKTIIAEAERRERAKVLRDVRNKLDEITNPVALNEDNRSWKALEDVITNVILFEIELHTQIQELKKV